MIFQSCGDCVLIKTGYASKYSNTYCFFLVKKFQNLFTLRAAHYMVGARGTTPCVLSLVLKESALIEVTRVQQNSRGERSQRLLSWSQGRNNGEEKVLEESCGHRKVGRQKVCRFDNKKFQSQLPGWKLFSLLCLRA